MRHMAAYRRMLVCAALFCAAGASPLVGLAQEAYPGKGPIKVIVPLPAGGAADVSVRVLTAGMQNTLKQSFVIENRPGGSFVIGMQALAKSPADGYTLMHLYPGVLAAQVASKKFDLLKTVTPVSLMGSMPSVLVVPASSPYKTVKDLVAAGLSRPGMLNYGSVGAGTSSHLWCANFSKHNHLDAVHVPFKGMPDATTALVAGELQFLPVAMSLALQFGQKNLIRPLAVLDTQRHPAMPHVPTIQEAGFDEPPMVYWGGLVAPKGTPSAIVEKLREHMALAVASDDVKTKLLAMGTEPLVSPSPQAFERVIVQELTWLNEAVKGMDLQLN